MVAEVPAVPAVKAIETDPFPAVAINPVGAPGRTLGVAVEAPDGRLGPAAVIARNRIEYEVPFTRPVTVTGAVVRAGTEATHAPEPIWYS
ncbi:unannotated protein [freshwater metagenome]|uniref:Unannotated protein n=1 Tax=freshwater metagenome TaxID=449393 RepID=A0A6J6HY93_9ZZZZ